MYIIFIIINLLLGIVIYLHYKKSFNYWKKKGLKTTETVTAPFGSIGNPFSRTYNLDVDLQHFYNYFKSKGMKHGGGYIFTMPIYIPTDLDIIKHILNVDFEHFNAKGLFYNERVNPISAHLFQIGGKRWKNLRMKSTCCFTSSKLKSMFDGIMKTSQLLSQALDNEPNPHEMWNVSVRFAISSLVPIVFGYDIDCFNEGEDFLRYGLKTIDMDYKRALKAMLVISHTKLARFLNQQMIPKDCEQFFTQLVDDGQRNFSLIDLLKDKIPNRQDVINQSFLFFIAGFETSSITTAYCLYELAANPAIQDRVRCEIEDVIAENGGEITYELLSKFDYLNQVIQETLRKYPPQSMLNRECTKPWKVPNTDVVIDEGTRIYISLYGIYNDAEYYPNPQKFDPERFSEENKQNRHPYTFLAFGDGQRMCIGKRLGYMQVKIGLITILRKYRLRLHPSTKYPLTYDKGINRSVGDILNVVCDRI